LISILITLTRRAVAAIVATDRCLPHVQSAVQQAGRALHDALTSIGMVRRLANGRHAVWVGRFLRQIPKFSRRPGASLG
jgi:hypothetical protein